MDGREGGTFSRDITKAKNGRWTFVDRLTKLKVGDVLYYWTYVDYFDGTNKLGYTNDDNKFTVTGNWFKGLIPHSDVLFFWKDQRLNIWHFNV